MYFVSEVIMCRRETKSIYNLVMELPRTCLNHPITILFVTFNLQWRLSLGSFQDRIADYQPLFGKRARALCCQHFRKPFFKVQRKSLNICIDPMQKCLPLYYSFVLIQISLTNLVFETKIVRNLLSRTRLVRLFFNTDKRIM